MIEKVKKVLIVDLEATCSLDNSITSELMEIIEIGAVWVTPAGDLLEQFQSYVRPAVNPLLTLFCTKLTGISQFQIDQACSWKKVAEEFSGFVERHKDAQSYWGSWGAYDKNQIERECNKHDTENPLRNIRHENLKANFAKNRKIKQVGMLTALKIAGLSVEGEHHSAISDALNIARLLPVSRQLALEK
jgi:inhibitor of KinA sporulation pathway (predicted exonuclease)